MDDDTIQRKKQPKAPKTYAHGEYNQIPEKTSILQQPANNSSVPIMDLPTKKKRNISNERRQQLREQMLQLRESKKQKSLARDNKINELVELKKQEQINKLEKKASKIAKQEILTQPLKATPVKMKPNPKVIEESESEEESEEEIVYVKAKPKTKPKPKKKIVVIEEEESENEEEEESEEEYLPPPPPKQRKPQPTNQPQKTYRPYNGNIVFH